MTLGVVSLEKSLAGPSIDDTRRAANAPGEEDVVVGVAALHVALCHCWASSDFCSALRLASGGS